MPSRTTKVAKLRRIEPNGRLAMSESVDIPGRIHRTRHKSPMVFIRSSTFSHFLFQYWDSFVPRRFDLKYETPFRYMEND